jgi:predicted transglutaminase-like cysteine proteinase
MTISRFWTLMLSAISIALVVSVPQSRAALPPDGGDSGQSAIYGAHAVFSSNIWQFRQWADAMDRAQRELAQTRICVDAADTGCTPRQWRTLIDELAGLPLRAKLERVNAVMNQQPYVTTQRNWGVPVYWETPFEFLAKGGQCQDYAISKYLALRAAGVPDENLRMLVVHDKDRNFDHAVLMVTVDGESYLLDSLSRDILPAGQVTHYRPYYAINQSGWWFYSGGNAMFAANGH